MFLNRDKTCRRLVPFSPNPGPSLVVAPRRDGDRSVLVCIERLSERAPNDL